VVACFALDRESGDIRFVHVMLADLIGHDKPDPDWKYVGSKVNQETGSQQKSTPESRNGEGDAFLEKPADTGIL